MPRTEGNYESLFERIEEKFDVNEMTKRNIQRYIGQGVGRESLAEQLSRVNEIYNMILDADDVNEIQELFGVLIW